MEPNEAAPGEDNRDETAEERDKREAAAEAGSEQDGLTSEEFDLETLRNILEGILLAAARPVSMDQMQTVLGGETAPDKTTIRQALTALEEDCAHRGIELVEVASGFRLQVRQEIQTWVSRLWEERPPRYSRALLETLALIAYRQPITRGEIEDVRGVSVSTNIIRQLEEREWIRVVGHRDVPGKPALFGTTKAFLDYFGLKSLDELPSLAEIRDIDSLEPEFDFGARSGSEQSDSAEDAERTTAAAGEDDASPAEPDGGEAADEAEALEQQAEAAAQTGDAAGATAHEPEPEEGDDTATAGAGDEAGEASSDGDREPGGSAEDRAGTGEADSDDREADGEDDRSLSDNAAASSGRH